MRLDLFLAESGLCNSRTDAKNFILSGSVTVDGEVVKKPSYDVDASQTVTVDKSTKKYVGRGGLKLEAAIKHFGICAKDRLAIDIGASSGGFTDCLLQNGAEYVYSLDVGHSQLDIKLRNDKRVGVIENFNARYAKKSDFAKEIDIIVMDVSFISQTLIYPACADILSGCKTMITLVKPQFEAGKKHIGKGGIVRDKNGSVIKEIMQRLDESANSCGFMRVGFCDSPIVGGDGNREYLAIFKRNI